MEELIVHTCATCEGPIAVILEDGILFPLCEQCRADLNAWLDECANASELEAFNAI